MRILYLSFFILLLTVSVPAQAESEIVHCGDPVATEINTDPDYKYCDIYQRQLAYRDEAINLREQLLERQENFAKPSLEAYRNYIKDREAMHDDFE